MGLLLLLLVLYIVLATAFSTYGLLCLFWPERAYKAAAAWMILLRLQRPDIDWEPIYDGWCRLGQRDCFYF